MPEEGARYEHAKARYEEGLWPVRDLFPQRPADRASVQYPIVDDPYRRIATKPRQWTRRARALARCRRWWRAHWWPARIRDLQAQIERLEEDWR